MERLKTGAVRREGSKAALLADAGDDEDQTCNEMWTELKQPASTTCAAAAAAAAFVAVWETPISQAQMLLLLVLLHTCWGSGNMPAVFVSLAAYAAWSCATAWIASNKLERAGVMGELIYHTLCKAGEPGDCWCSLLNLT